MLMPIEKFSLHNGWETVNFDLLCFIFLSASSSCYIEVAAIDYEVVSWQVIFLMSIDIQVFF